jgi:polyisoprenoid-binding protein YceI
MDYEVAAKTQWSVDQDYSELAFKVRHMMISHVKGIFRTFEGTIRTTAKDFTTAEIKLYITPSSIDTGVAKHDRHFKGSDFLDVKKQNKITFISKKIGKADPIGLHDLWGELTIKGITKNVQLKVHFGDVINDFSGTEKLGFNISGKVKRSDFGLLWTPTIETVSLLLSEYMTITFDLVLSNQTQKYSAIDFEMDTQEQLVAI